MENAILFVDGDISREGDFAEISFWSLVLEKTLNFFGLLPNTEDKSLENALLFLNGDIAEKLVGNVVLCCCDFAEMCLWSLVLEKKS